jgi:phosphatidylethanolamine/phosphatidyl-N-methylethanolamine N-methyltransferase
MDALSLAFPASRFDVVYAAYVLNVVQDPFRALREMARVCRSGGRIVLVNHFAPAQERWLSRLAWRAIAGIGSISWNLERDPFLRAGGLTIETVEHVNLGISSIVVCRKPPVSDGACV